MVALWKLGTAYEAYVPPDSNQPERIAQEDLVSAICMTWKT